MARPLGSAPAEEAPARSGPGAVAWIALLLGLYAAVVASLGLFGASKGGGGSPTVAAGGDDLDRRLASNAATLRSEIQDDLRRQASKAEEAFTRAERRLDETRGLLEKRVEDGRRLAENATRTSSNQTETIETRIREVADTTGRLQGTLDTLQTTVKDLASRPVAAAPRAGGTAPTPVLPPTPTIPTPVKPADPDPAAGPTPEQLAANREKVKVALADLASPDIGKVFPACVALGRLGDLEAVDPLVKVMREHKDPYARTAAATALGRLHACDAVSALLQTFLDRDDGVVLAAGAAFGQIAGVDSGFTGSPTRKERNDARDRWSKWWGENEAKVRLKWNQPKKDAPAPADAGK